MKKSRENLKATSIIVLAFAGLSLINTAFEVFFGALKGELDNAVIPKGAPENIVLIAQIVILAISFLLLFPQIYIGFKGLKMAKNPDSSSAHIFWGVVVLVTTALGLVAPIVALVQRNGDVFENVAQLFSLAVDVIIMFEYVRYARAVRNGI